MAKRETLAAFDTDSRKQVILKCDACDEGMGAVLEQEQESGEFMPITYWSSRFRKYELGYSIGEKEALACVSTIEKHKKYLHGRHFILQTDHKSLVTLLSQSKIKRTMARIERWREKLSCYNYTVKYINGTDNEISDLLSRTTTDSNHNTIPLNEEVVINSVRKYK